jgi:hypothetical protein
MTLLMAATVFAVSTCTAQDDVKRSRGEGFYSVVSSNTVAGGDVWVTGRILGFLWDDPLNPGGTNKPHGFLPRNIWVFPELAADLGLFDLASLTVESRVLSYGYQFGEISGAAKFTYPDNKKLRLNGYGIELKYLYNFINEHPTLGGFPGFMPEGYVALGHVAQAKFLYDLDMISKWSFLPFKVSANLGIRMPLAQEFRPYSQYLVAAALAYVGVDVDVFIEYSLEAFVNKSTDPKLFNLGGGKIIEVAFSENPMYVTPGARMRYPNGINLYACVPLLLSVNSGSVLKNYGNQFQIDFPAEAARGVTQGFDPWFVKWKIVAQMTVPLHYTQTSAEMTRNFLLLKNRPKRTRINLDEKIQGMGPTPAAPVDSTANQKTDQQRLDEIKKQREEMSK